MLQELGGRKFLFSLLVAVGLFTLAIVGKIGYGELQTGLLWTLGIFSVTNAGQKVAEALK